MTSLRGAVDRTRSAAVVLSLRRAGVELGRAPRFFGRPIVSIAPGSTLRLGARFCGISRSRDTALGVSHPLVLRTMRPGARLHIGADVGISGGSICAAYRVEIGDGCILGADTMVIDTDFHPVDHPDRRHAAPPEPSAQDAVTIGRNVFLGARVIVLRGASIGDGAVVGAGSVIAGRIEAGAVVAGPSVRTLRMLSSPAEQAGPAVRR